MFNYSLFNKIFRSKRSSSKTLFNRTINTTKDMMNNYTRNKSAVIVGGLVLASSAITLVRRFVPKVSKGIGKVVKKAGKGRRVGRASNVPPQQEGSMQDAVERNIANAGKPFQETKPVKKSLFSRMKKNRDNGDNAFLNTRNSSTLTEKDISRMSNPDEHTLRLQKQIVKACKQYNLVTNTMKVRYDLDPLKIGLWVYLADRLIKVNQKGIYSGMGNPYFIHGRMNPSDALTRLVSDFSYHQLDLFTDFIMAYDMDLYDVSDIHLDDEKESENQQQDKKKPKRINSLGFEEEVEEKGTAGYDHDDEFEYEYIEVGQQEKELLYQ